VVVVRALVLSGVLAALIGDVWQWWPASLP